MRRRTLLALLLLALACGRGAREGRRPPTAPKDGGTLVRRLELDLQTLNYVLQTTEYERYVLDYLYDPLIRLDRDLRPIPGTATRWETSPDGRVWTLHLDPRSTFSDGTPVLASDVVFTFRKVIEAESQQFSGFFDGLDLKNTVAVDPHTVRAVFATPLAARWYAFNIGVLPEHVYGRGDFKNAFNDVAVGNGPYRLVRWERGKSVLLERRRDYPGPRPHLDRILFKVIADDSVAWNAMKRGELDEMLVRTNRWAAEKDDPKVRATVRFFDIYPLSYNCIAWNLRHRVLSDGRVRRALAMAFDRDSVIRHLYEGEARAVSGPFAPDQWAYDRSIPPVPYDPAAAARLLDAAGWRDRDGDGVRDRGGEALAFAMLLPSGNAPGATQSQILQSALRRIGVRMEITTVDGAVFGERVMKGDFDAAFFGWSLDPDPDLFSLFHSSQRPPNGLNVVGYADPEVDRLIEEARRTLPFDARRTLYHRLHARLAADQPYAWTVQIAQKWAVNRRVHDVESSSGFGLFLWYPGPEKWWVE